MKENVIGWFGIVVPTRNFYQGFHLSDADSSAANAAMTEFRRLTDKLEQVITIEPLSGVAAQDQKLLGALASTAVETCLARDPKIKVIGRCISMLLGTNYFYVKGGSTSSHAIIARLPVHTPAMARTVFHLLADVRAIDANRQETL